MAEVKKALSDNTTPSQFLELYAHEKPGKENQIIFSCRSGKRAEEAAQIAIQLGFKK